MSFSGGVFSRLYDWTDDRDGGIKILASRMDEEMDGFATGLSTCILKDGSQTVTANIPMGTYKFTGLGAGTGAGESVSYEQVVLLSAGANQTITRSAAGTVLTLESTEAGATSGPDLSLHRNSASPADNDVLASILFDGEDDGSAQTSYARIQASALDVTNATEDGNLRFGVMTAGSLADVVTLTGATAAFVNSITITNSTPTITMTDSDTGADSVLTASSTAGSIALRADVNNEVASSKIIFGVDGTDVATLDSSGVLTGDIINSTNADSLLDTLGTETNGALPYHNGTSWAVLAPP